VNGGSVALFSMTSFSSGESGLVDIADYTTMLIVVVVQHTILLDEKADKQ
jgi:hypothetical protein